MKQRSYFTQYGNMVVYFVWDKLYGQFFKGTAVCRPEDTFELETGINIARTKAVIKMRSWYTRVLQDRLAMIDRLKREEADLRNQYTYWLGKTKESCNKLNNILANLEK